MLAACVILFGGIIFLRENMPEQFSVVGGSELKLEGAVTAKTTGSFAADSAMQVTMIPPGNSYTASLRLFGVFPIKEITVKVVEATSVIPSGAPFGIKMYTDGVLVVGMSEVDSANGPKNPARSSGIKVGDVLISMNTQTVLTTEQVAGIVENSGGAPITVRVRRNNIEFDINLTPEKSVNENRYKAGLWVRDSSAGIGTLTFIMPDSNIFGGLGHAICDVDTGEIIPLSSGKVVPARIYSVVKGQVGQPGELRGGFEPGTLGNLTINSETGVYGVLDSSYTSGEAVSIAMKQQVKTGYAQILCTIDGTTPQYYDIEIEQVRYNDSSPTRNMTVRITDPRLLDQTGGIIQGMSGSPILQDGMLAGAITHVLVNDPERGFAIFAENMLRTASSQKPAA